jgi:hypothetical protein
MSTFDEITKEKQRLGEALARVDAQREKLTSQLNELEATERVLARYSTGPQPKCRPRERRRLVQRDYAGAGALPPQNQLAAAAARRASTIRFLP